jgi:predicted metal-binding membrane protein
MLLLFALGVMNLLWSAILTGIVLIEKIVPGGYWFSRLVGLLSLGWGAWFLVQALRM